MAFRFTTNDGGGKFTEVTKAAWNLAVSVSPLRLLLSPDVDHDGDLDILITGLADLSKPLKTGAQLTSRMISQGAPKLLLRNDGNGKFTGRDGYGEVE